MLYYEYCFVRCHTLAFLLTRKAPAPTSGSPIDSMVSVSNNSSSSIMGKMIAPAAPQRGPCIRFEGITLELSSFSGLQFDFAKDGNLVLTCEAFSGTVTLKSAADAHPLCSAGSEAGSLGVLDADAGMDQMEIDMALSQLEQGDSPKPPSGMLFSSASAMRQTCEGSSLTSIMPDRTSDDLNTITNNNNNDSTSSTRNQAKSFAALVSPSNSTAEEDSFGEKGVSAQKNKRNAPSPVVPANTPSSAKKTTVSPDSGSSKPKDKRPRRTPRDQPSSKSATAAAAASGSHSDKENIHRDSNNRIEEDSAAATQEAATTAVVIVGSSRHEDGTAAPASCAAAAWIASTTPSSPGPLSRSAKAALVGVDGGVGVGSRRGGSSPMGRWGHSATMVSDSKMLVLGGQADDDAHQATLGDLYKFDFGEQQRDGGKDKLKSIF